MPEPSARSRRGSQGQRAAGVLATIAVVIAAAVGPARGDDPPVAPEERARRALEAAGTLDAQAQRAATVAEGRARWLDAARALDDALKADPTGPAAPSLRFQAAVYLWARARSRLDQVELLAPADPTRAEVARELDDVVGRLRAIPTATEPGDPVGPNVRFRLAQALADRARLRADDDPARAVAEREARALLERLGDDPRLRAFARLLHAELGIRLGLAGPVQVEIEAIEKLDPPAPAIALTSAKVDALIARGMLDEAARVADRATAPADQKALWRLRTVLARRKQANPGLGRDALDAEAFGLARSLRGPGAGGDGPRSRRGLMELARAIDRPAAQATADAWDLLADGCLLLAEPDRAGVIAERGADRAAAVDPDRANALRLKAGAAWFQAAKFAEADRILTRVVADVAAPRPLRARAGMLRALARGRGLATRQPGASRTDYLAALEEQVRDFPVEPSTGEARWLLGKLRLAAGRRDEAIDLWAGLGVGQARWLEAQAAAADESIAALEEQWINRDLAAIRPRLEATRAMVQAAIDQASEGEGLVQLQLRRGRLDTIPGLGRPAEAVAVMDRLLRGPADAEEHRQARLLRLVALAEANRFGEAETVARAEARADDLAALWPAIRGLDRFAATTDNDSARRRAGNLLRTLLDRWADPIDRTPAADRDEVALRHARALFFAGDPAGARRELARWGGPVADIADADLIRDLGDTYFRLEAYPLAADVERLRATHLKSGSPAWCDARYNLALALFRSNRAREAAQIIEATTILHPDLGGGETRANFDRLSQKLHAR